MGQTIEAIHDGAVFRPTVPVALKPNTRVRVTVAPDEAAIAPGVSFLDMASALNLEGPEDWSANVEDYLYGRLDERAARVFPGHGLRLPSGRPRVNTFDRPVFECCWRNLLELLASAPSTSPTRPTAPATIAWAPSSSRCWTCTSAWPRSRSPTSRPRSSVRSRPPTGTPQADALVYELYGLTEEEVKIVEEG